MSCCSFGERDTERAEWFALPALISFSCLRAVKQLSGVGFAIVCMRFTVFIKKKKNVMVSSKNRLLWQILIYLKKKLQWWVRKIDYYMRNINLLLKDEVCNFSLYLLSKRRLWISLHLSFDFPKSINTVVLLNIKLYSASRPALFVLRTWLIPQITGLVEEWWACYYFSMQSDPAGGLNSGSKQALINHPEHHSNQVPTP